MDLDDEELEATRKMLNLQNKLEATRKMLNLRNKNDNKLEQIKEILKSDFMKYDESEDEFYYEDIIVNKQIEKIRKIVGD